MIKKLSDDILLNIFYHFLHASPQFWHALTHVCQKWRQIIFESPLGLPLRLYCTYGTPVLKTLGHWPPFPLGVNYGEIHRPPAPEDKNKIIVAIEHTDRVRSISFTVSSSLLKKLSAISEPFLELEYLVLLSKDSSQSILPSAFRWGHRLRTLHSTRIAFPSLPQLLLPSQNLVDIQLDEIPSAGYFSPEAFANALCGMTQLETLSLHFLTYPPRRNFLSLPLFPQDRVLLPALTAFKYRGTSKYLDILVARIDAPRLGDINFAFFSQPTLDALQIGLFVNRIELWGSPPRADILFSGDTISITFSHPEISTRLGLQISCKQLDWQVSSVSQICAQVSSFLFSVEDLRIEVAGISGPPDDTDDERWLRLVRTFNGAKDFHLAGELVTAILRALRLADEGHDIVLPALRNLYVLQPVSTGGPQWDSVESFVTQRELSGLPIQIYVQQRSSEESMPVAIWRQQVGVLALVPALPDATTKQQPSSLGTQSTLTGIRKSEDVMVSQPMQLQLQLMRLQQMQMQQQQMQQKQVQRQQMQQQQRLRAQQMQMQMQLQRQLQQQQQQQLQQQQQHLGGESILTTPHQRQQVCLAIAFLSSLPSLVSLK